MHLAPAAVCAQSARRVGGNDRKEPESDGVLLNRRVTRDRFSVTYLEIASRIRAVFSFRIVEEEAICPDLATCIEEGVSKSVWLARR